MNTNYFNFDIVPKANMESRPLCPNSRFLFPDMYGTETERYVLFHHRLNLVSFTKKVLDNVCSAQVNDDDLNYNVATFGSIITGRNECAGMD